MSSLFVFQAQVDVFCRSVLVLNFSPTETTFTDILILVYRTIGLSILSAALNGLVGGGCVVRGEVEDLGILSLGRAGHTCIEPFVEYTTGLIAPFVVGNRDRVFQLFINETLNLLHKA